MHRFRFLIVALVGVFIALASLSALASLQAPDRTRALFPDGGAKITVAPQCGARCVDAMTGWTINAPGHIEPRQIVKLGAPRPAEVIQLAQVDHNPKFIPLCSVLDDNPGDIECIPNEAVQAAQELRLWNYASRQLRKCGIVVLDPDGPYVAENLGYQCDGVITGAGIVPDDEDDAP